MLDSITHVTPDGKWFDTRHDASLSRLLREMDQVGVERAVVVALAGYIDNAFIMRTCTAHPDRLVPGVSVDPSSVATPTAARELIRAILESSGASIVKLHPRLNRYSPLDERFLVMLEEMAESFPHCRIWLDTLFHTVGVPLPKGPVEIAHELVCRFPELKFVLLHACGPDALRLAGAVRNCCNAFVDLSVTLTSYAESSVEQDLCFMMEKYDQKILFGSDFPECSLLRAKSAFDRLGSRLTEVKRRNILGKNLETLLWSD